MGPPLAPALLERWDAVLVILGRFPPILNVAHRGRMRAETIIHGAGGTPNVIIWGPKTFRGGDTTQTRIFVSSFILFDFLFLVARWSFCLLLARPASPSH